MSSLSQIFKIGDSVEALDEVFIWWPCKIVAFVDQWTAEIKWNAFPQQNSTVSVPEVVRDNLDLWTIRHVSTHDGDTLPPRRARNKQRLTDYVPRFQSRNDMVCFMADDGSRSNVRVFINDTVNENIMVFLEDEYERWLENEEPTSLRTNLATIDVKYGQLCNFNCTNQDDPDSSFVEQRERRVQFLEEEEDEATTTGEPPSTSTSAPPRRRSRHSNANKPMIDIASLIPVSVCLKYLLNISIFRVRFQNVFKKILHCGILYFFSLSIKSD